jgi:hypothetical protein
MPTKPPLPALIIGLGGSGATTVRHIKQQLYNTYDNTLPETVGLLVLDTSKNPLAQASRMTNVGLEVREFGHLGGHAKSMVERAAADGDGMEHVSSWLQADYYLKNLPDNLFQLEDGAGQYRQLGRLALFRDVAATNSSQFYQRVNEKITSIKRAAGSGRSLMVFIIGSLAGGTGAGLFIDAAYLVRQIAQSQQMDIRLRGYFYLPEAFAATLNVSDRKQARPRSFAALRELSRFVLHEDYDLGYPLYYQNARYTADVELWRGRLRSKLYDLVYLIDGQGSRSPMAEYPLENGVTPSVADTILAFMDSDAGEYQNSYIVNISQQVINRQTRDGRVPYVGSLGTYSIVLPIQQIIDGWAYRLGIDTLNNILMPNRFDETTGLPLELATDANPERAVSAEEEVRALLSSRDAVIDPRDTNQRIFPTALWPKLYQWHTQREANESGAARQMSGYGAEEWLSSLRPSAADRGQDAASAERVVDAVINKNVETEIQFSREVKADPAQDYRRIINETERLFNGQLGLVKGNGQREGGIFRDKLGDLLQLQVNRFRNALEVYTLLQLNGQEGSNAEIARRGKLGWTIATYEELEDILTSVLQLLGRVRTSNQGAANMRNQILQNLESTQTDMIQMSSKGRGKAFKAQEVFRDAAEQVLDMYRAEIARDAVEDVVRQMREYVISAKEQLERWKVILATHHESLFAKVYRGSQQVLTGLDKEERVPGRQIIRDPDWEQDRYATYLELSDALNRSLTDLVWMAQEDKDESGRPRLRIMLTINDEPLRDDMRGEWGDKNSQLLMNFCREIFSEARERESVLSYLAQYSYRDQPERLAQLLFERSGALLSFDESNMGNFVPGVYLLAHQDSNYPENGRFLRDVMSQLRGHVGVAETDQTLARLQDCDDRFRLTLVSMVELLPLNKINAYKDSQSDYLSSPGNERPLLHLFPAEVNAVRYEDQLHKLNQSRRLISNRVALLLENINRFRDFLALMAHRIVGEDRDYLDEKDNRFVYFLTTPSKDEPDNPDAIDEWWLTKPSGDPSLLEAVTTYIFREEDYGRRVHEPDYRFAINYDHVTQHLLNVRQYDTEQRLQAGYETELGQFRPEMMEWLKQYPEDSAQFNALARLIVEHDVLREFSDWLQNDQLPMIQKRRSNPESQTAPGQMVNQLEQESVNDLYDFYSLAIIVLTEMVDSKYKDAELLAGQRRTLR